MKKNSFCIDARGWLTPALQKLSPNCDARLTGVKVDLLVIHNISLPPGKFDGDAVENFFLNQLDCTQHPYYEKLKNLTVSAHLFVRRNGAITQFVPFTARAWHAGESSFAGVPNCNDYSIGIELEGSDETAFTDAQYETLISITQALMQHYPGITRDRITGHSEIAPHRKTDPGPHFDWTRFKKGL